VKSNLITLWTIVVLAMLSFHCAVLHIRLTEAQDKIKNYELELSNYKTLLRNASYRWPEEQKVQCGPEGD
jgi:hypothetical protein